MSHDSWHHDWCWPAVLGGEVWQGEQSLRRGRRPAEPRPIRPAGEKQRLLVHPPEQLAAAEPHSQAQQQGSDAGLSHPKQNRCLRQLWRRYDRHRVKCWDKIKIDCKSISRTVSSNFESRRSSLILIGNYLFNECVSECVWNGTFFFFFFFSSFIVLRPVNLEKYSWDDKRAAWRHANHLRGSGCIHEQFHIRVLLL